MLPAKSSRESRVEMTEMVLPQHTNPLGGVFGGVILSWVDIAAAIAAQRHSSQVVVTAFVDGMHFMQPIQLGWIVTLKASVNLVFRSSCEVGVKIFAENPLTRVFHHTGSAYLTMVALDGQRNPTPMPPLLLETDEDHRRAADAGVRRNMRLSLRKNR